MNTLSGQTVSHYRILEELGRGGMGVVYKAEDTKLKRTVALKFLPQHLTTTEEERSRFQQEAQAAATLNHPNICTIHAIGDHDGQQFIDMEYIEGATLRAKLPIEKFSDAVAYAVQIGEALHEAHSKGIVHRDIKADNIMVNSKSQVKVMDFGLAKLRGSLKLTRTSSTVGTLAYMAPEQISGGATDTRSDIFSFGVVLYELLAGRTPFRGDHEAAMVYSIVNEEPEPIQKFCPDISPEFLHILSRALEKDPEDRYQSVNEMVIDLRRLKKQSTKLSRTYAVQRDVAQPQSQPDLTPSLQQSTAGKAGNTSTKRYTLMGFAALALVAVIIAIYKFVGSGQSESISAGPVQATFAQLTDQAGVEFNPDISPDGNFIVYSKDVAGYGDIFLHRIGGGNPINLTRDSKANDDEPAFSPDGQWIAFHSDRDGGGIFVMGSTGESVRRLTDFGFNPAWTSDGKAIICATEDIKLPTGRKTTSKLWIIDAKSGEKKILFEGDAVQPACSPHGIRVAYWGLPIGTGQRDLWTIPLSGGTPVAVTNDADVDWNPVWSPEGNYLYFSSDRGGSMNLWRIPLDEESGKAQGLPQPITTPSPWAGPLKVSHDGRHIVYVSLDAKGNINRIPFDPVKGKCVGPSVSVTQGSKQITRCDPSPDNQYLVYSSQGKQEDLFIIKNDGSSVRQLTDDIYKDRGPQWSPDGKRIMFYSNRTGRYEIWAINADGSGLEQLTRTSGESPNLPLWFPDGKRIALSLETCSIVDLGQPIEQRTPTPIAPLEDKDQSFYASSVSSDGKFLAGYRARSNGEIVPGVVIYSMENRHFQTVADSGRFPLWLNDSRRLLFRKEDRVFLLNVQTGKSHEVLTFEMNKDQGWYALSSDNRTLYAVRSTMEADIWQAELR